MRTNRLLMAAAASVMAFALTGCGDDGGGGGKIPTAESGSASSGTGTGQPPAAGGGDQAEIAEYVAAKRKWVACMREQGFDYPDPGPLGQIETDGDTNRAMKKNPKFTVAQEKCKEFNVTVPMAVEKAMRPKMTPEQIKTAREFADCMQNNGAPDFPDPGPDGYPTVNENDGVQDWDPSTAGAKRAGRVCAPIKGDDVPVNPPPAKG
ncbi:hypothetical protein [Streptomyces sp. NPDC056527]|uniref:hypothetical protein n=1 Tax=Streptomyces sp. NPDC056527 TaxID=3345853 RepID=UPI00369D85C7